jgi:DNA-binding transcriptional regulator YhcF (GntR family)
MKWFKHDANARHDTKIKLLKKKYGAEGYGIYFQLLEIVAENIKDNNQNEWSFVEEIHTVETLADESGVSPDRLRKLLRYMNELGLIYHIDHKLCAPKILRRLDEFSQRRKKDLDVFQREDELSRLGRESIGTESGTNRALEQIKKRTDKEQIKKREEHTLITDLKEKDFEEISTHYGVPLAFVKSKYDDMVNWHDEDPSRHKKLNWKATLRNWVKRDAIKIRQEAVNVKSKRAIDASNI